MEELDRGELEIVLVLIANALGSKSFTNGIENVEIHPTSLRRISSAHSKMVEKWKTFLTESERF